jgi:hypothetical protein
MSATPAQRPKATPRFKKVDQAPARPADYSTPKNAVDAMEAWWNDFKAKSRTFIKPTAILFALYVIMVSAILLANYTYKDDNDRIMSGVAGWENFSRYLSNFLSHFVHAGSFLTDVSPLPQLLACLLLALTSALALYLIARTTRFTALMYFSTIPFVLCPYFLECISFKYDAPYMALSVLASVAPLALRNAKYRYFIPAVFLGELVVCATYQASSGILPILAVFLCFLDWSQNRKPSAAFKALGVAAASYLAALLFFKLFLMVPVEWPGYVSTTVGVGNGLFTTALSNYKKYLTTLLADFKTTWLLLMALVAVLAYVATIVQTKQSRGITALVAIPVFAFVALFCLGVYPFLTDSLFEPRAMYGIGACVGIFAMYLASLPHALVGKVVVLGLSWCFFAFAFTYGNALSAQAQWTDFRIQITLNDLDSIEEFDAAQNPTVYLSGTVGLAQVIQNQPQNYNMLKRLVPIQFDGETRWGLVELENYYGVEGVTFERDDGVPLDTMTLCVSNMYEDIYYKDNEFVVFLK